MEAQEESSLVEPPAEFQPKRLPTEWVAGEFGERLDPAHLLEACPEYDPRWSYRRMILAGLVRYYYRLRRHNAVPSRAGEPRRALTPRDKNTIRRTMALLDNAATAEITGVRFDHSKCERKVGPDANVGDDIFYRILFRGVERGAKGWLTTVAVCPEADFDAEAVQNALEVYRNRTKGRPGKRRG